MQQPAEQGRERDGAATIRSAQHPWVKRLGAILAGQEREACALEGDRLIDDARQSGLEFEVILVADDREKRALELEREGAPVQRIASELLARKSALRTSPGIAGIARAPRPRTLDEFATAKDALVLVIAGVADPGNLGALARCAEAAGAAGIALVAVGASPWNDKSLRGSMGSLLRLPVAVFASAAQACAALRQRGFRLVGAATRGGVALDKFDWRGPVALWIGPETGADPREMDAFERVTIPMAGQVESLNVTVAAALLLFAAGRVPKGRP